MEVRILIEVFGWLGNISFIIGAYDFSKKHINGFYWNSVANFLYTIQSLVMSNWPLFWLSIILIGINIRGIYKWSHS